jgi:hypothetical protein
MENTLVIITLVSLALASAMSVVTLRIVALDRRRESARVAALVDLAREDADEDWRLTRGPERPAAPRREVLNVPIERAASQAAAQDSSLFTAPERESPTGRRLVAVVTVAGVMAIAVGALIFAGSEPTAGSQSQEAATRAPAPSEAATVGTTGVPLELMSLRHQRDGEKLTITGLVLNPRQGVRVERVSAVVYVFDSDGVFLASGRALVDYTKLDPGDESPFVVTVIAPGKIGRYRVGFRGQDGAVVGHVDRRAGLQS